MKRYMDYEEFKSICLQIAHRVKDQEFDEVVAVMRGGLSAGHLIARELKISMGVWEPASGKFMTTGDYPNGGKFLVVEDIIALGRTYGMMGEFAKQYPQHEFHFCPIVIDKGWWDASLQDTPPHYGIVTDDWIVFPFEKMEHAVEGTRGLFRKREDKYGRQNEE